MSIEHIKMIRMVVQNGTDHEYDAMVEHGEAYLLGTNSKAPRDNQPVVNAIFPHLKCSSIPKT